MKTDENGRQAAGDLAHLTAEARHHRQRYDLYKARVYALRPTTDSRLRELQRICEGAEARLAAAIAARRAGRP